MKVKTDFEPDYQNLVNAARNIKAERIPLYEHGISFATMEALSDVKFAHLFESKDMSDLRTFFRHYNNFHRMMGYDAVTWELGMCSAFPGGGCLGLHQPATIRNRDDFDNYPWETVADKYFDLWSNHYRALRDEMPAGMKAVGGPGNGLFECVQDLLGYENLCLLIYDDPKLCENLFEVIGDISVEIWKRFLAEFGDIYAVCRFGDDLGFRTATLLPPDYIREKIIPCYRRVIDLIHSCGKPFLLHSCGNIFSVMDDLIEVAGIDAKHSNEDAIAPFSTWVERYGDRIGLFGGLDVDLLCQKTPQEIRKHTLDLLESLGDCAGIAFGSGNSIPDYMPIEGYLAMVETIKEFRGDFD